MGEGPGGDSGSVSHKRPDRVANTSSRWRLCSYNGERCRYPHSYHISDSIMMLTPLKGHEKVITGIALPPSRTSCTLGARIWNCSHVRLPDRPVCRSHQHGS